MCDVLIIKKMYVWNFSRCLFNSYFPPGVVVLPLKELQCFRPCLPCSERNLRIKLKTEDVDQFYNFRTQMAQAEEPMYVQGQLYLHREVLPQKQKSITDAI